MTKTITDPLTRKPITINYIASVGVGTMCHDTVHISETIPKGSRSMAQVAYTKGDLEAFGSFFQ